MGVLLGGVPGVEPAHVLIIGAGVVGAVLINENGTDDEGSISNAGRNL